MDQGVESEAPKEANIGKADFGQFFMDEGDNAFDFAIQSAPQDEGASSPGGQDAAPSPPPVSRDNYVFVCATSPGSVDASSFDQSQGPIDLTELGLSFAQLSDRLQDNGCATAIDLSGIDHGSLPEKIVLPDVKLAELGVDDFIL